LIDVACSGGPLSEHFGRRIITHVGFFFFIFWTLGAALSPNWPALLVFRFLAGFVGSSPIAVVTGILADIFDDPGHRGYAMAFFMAV
jgi:MFS family permease